MVQGQLLRPPSGALLRRVLFALSWSGSAVAPAAKRIACPLRGTIVNDGGSRRPLSCISGAGDCSPRELDSLWTPRGQCLHFHAYDATRADPLPGVQDFVCRGLLDFISSQVGLRLSRCYRAWILCFTVWCVPHERCAPLQFLSGICQRMSHRERYDCRSADLDQLLSLWRGC